MHHAYRVEETTIIAELYSSDFFFFKRRQKLCLNLLIKKKRIARLICGKPSENRYNKPRAHPGADRETGQAPGWPMCVGLEILVYMIFCKFQGKF
jgi:hypothetical protein